MGCGSCGSFLLGEIDEKIVGAVVQVGFFKRFFTVQNNKIVDNNKTK